MKRTQCRSRVSTQAIVDIMNAFDEEIIPVMHEPAVNVDLQDIPINPMFSNRNFLSDESCDDSVVTHNEWQ